MMWTEITALAFLAGGLVTIAGATALLLHLIYGRKNTP